MKDHRVAIDTDRENGILFRITENGGLFRVYRHRVGIPWDSSVKIGESSSLHAAISLAKSEAGGCVRDVRVRGW